jgi:hypothetical protein
MESYILSLHFSDHFTKEAPSVHQHSLIALCAEHGADPFSSFK